MSDQNDLNFAGADDAKVKKGTTGTARDAVALEIMEILRQIANGSPPDQPDPFADELPGG